MAAAVPGISYAPEDPNLPKPWKGLVDDKTGYLYYWNPETNITQYEKPVASGDASTAPSHKSLSSSVQKSPEGRYNPNDNDDRYAKTSNGLSKAASSVAYQDSTSRSGFSQGDVEVRANVVYGSHASNGAESVVSAEAYRRRHEISVTGDNVPHPFSTFEATGFSSEILREVRYLLQQEPNVVRCAALPWRACMYLEYPYDGPICEGFSESSSLAGTSIGSDSVCPLVRIEEEASSYYCLLQQAVPDSGGMMLLISLATCIIRKETNPNLEAPHMLMSRGYLVSFYRCTMLVLLLQLQYRRSHGRLL